MESNLIFDAIRDFKKKHPVRQEKTQERNLEFSAYLRKTGRPSQRGCRVKGIEVGAFTANDLDFILWDYERRMLQLLEVKTRNGKVGYSQSQVLGVLDVIIRAGAPVANVKYLGFHILVMDDLKPSSSKKILWDGDPVSKEVCWQKINMLDEVFTQADERDERMNRYPNG